MTRTHARKHATTKQLTQTTSEKIRFGGRGEGGGTRERDNGEKSASRRARRARGGRGTRRSFVFLPPRLMEAAPPPGMGRGRNNEPPTNTPLNPAY